MKDVYLFYLNPSQANGMMPKTFLACYHDWDFTKDIIYNSIYRHDITMTPEELFKALNTDFHYYIEINIGPYTIARALVL